MRVIAGLAGGITLVRPRGKATRPVADRVKETLFAILADRVPGARALDLYAGSGAIGIEALSRGAAGCLFVEQDRAAVEALRENLRRTHLEGQAVVRVASVQSFLAAALDDRFDLAFLDPPYAERAILAPLQRLVPRLNRGATVVLKHFWRTPIPTVDGLVPWRERRFGETVLSFLEARQA